jgi:hypothetical protein
VHVTVDQPRNDAPALEVDAPGVGPGQPHDLAFLAHRQETAVAHRDRLRLRPLTVERRNLAVEEDEIRLRAHQCAPSCAPNMVLA